MKHEISPTVAIIIIVAVVVIVGFLYARTWFEGPKRISGTPPSGVNIAPSLSGQQNAPMMPPPPPQSGYGR